MLSLSNKICDNAGHPLNTFYKVLPSGRWYWAVKIRTSRFKNSFIPVSISEINKVGILNNDLADAYFLKNNLTSVTCYLQKKNNIDNTKKVRGD